MLATRAVLKPVSRGASENPNPGTDAATTWKARAGSPPCARGSVSGPMSLVNSTIEFATRG